MTGSTTPGAARKQFDQAMALLGAGSQADGQAGYEAAGARFREATEIDSVDGRRVAGADRHGR